MKKTITAGAFLVLPADECRCRHRAFAAGVIGCEGRNRFCGFKIAPSAKMK